MSVPDTTNFSLQDVVDEILPDAKSLQGCFNEADTDAFDPAYEGSKDRLSNFRNYAHRRWITIRPYLYFGKDQESYAVKKELHSYHVNFAYVRSCFVGLPVILSGGDIEISVRNFGGVYYIYRGYLLFDLRGLQGTAVKVELYLRRTAFSDVGLDIYIDRANWTEPLDIGEFCSTIALLLSGGQSAYQQGDSSWVHKIEATSGDMNTFNSVAMNAKLYTEMRHNYDYNNNAPSLNDYLYRTYYNGASISQSLVYNAELRVKYTGLSFLSAYPDPCNLPIIASSERIFITANDQNNWTATVTIGSSWLSITGANTGEGSYKFEISFIANTVPNSPRSGEITIVSDDANNFIVNVEQEGTRLTADPNPWYVDSSGDTQYITIEANPTNSWVATVTIGAAWLHVSSGSGTGDGGFYLEADENTGGLRLGEATINHDGSNYIVYVEQSAGP